MTPEQIDRLDLPTQPVKADSRFAFKGPTAQAEAIAPDMLADIVREAIESRLDLAAYRRVLKREDQVRRDLAARLSSIDET